MISGCDFIKPTSSDLQRDHTRYSPIRRSLYGAYYITSLIYDPWLYSIQICMAWVWSHARYDWNKILIIIMLYNISHKKGK